GGAEVVGRYAGDPGAVAVGFEREERAMRPDVGAVAGDEDRGVADHPDAAAVRMGAQGRPLPPGDPLAELPEADLLVAARLDGAQRRGVAIAQARRPVLPGLARVGGGDCHEAGVVVEPVAFGDAEGFVAAGLAHFEITRG